MNKQEQAEQILQKHIKLKAPNPYVISWEVAVAAIVEAMELPATKSDDLVASDIPASAEEVLYKHILADADNHVMGTTLTVTVPPLEELKNNQQFQMHVAAMKEYAQQFQTTPAKEAMTDGEYQKGLESLYQALLDDTEQKKVRKYDLDSLRQEAISHDAEQKKAKQAMNVPAQGMEWTPVTELPEQGKWYLIHTTECGVIEGFLDGGEDGKLWLTQSGDLSESDTVTHWMPLPEPPSAQPLPVQGEE